MNERERVAALIREHTTRDEHDAARLANAATRDELDRIAEHARNAAPRLAIAGVVFAIARRVDGERSARLAAARDHQANRNRVPDCNAAERGRPVETPHGRRVRVHLPERDRGDD